MIVPFMPESYTRPPRVDALHVFVLGNLAFAGRVYATLGEQSTFFVAHRSTAGDILGMMLIISLAVPLMFVVAEWLAGLAGYRARVVVHGFLVAFLLIAIMLPLLKTIDSLSGPIVVAAACTVAALLTAMYFRFAKLGVLVTILWPVVLFFPGFFLFGTPVFGLVFGSADSGLGEVKIGRPAPVVMIVLDEVCGMSLMNERREIDAVRYPNIAALAADGTWFRNATTMALNTHQAVPSLLTGCVPRESSVPPDASAYPNSLFTLLEESHDLVVQETSTSVCPRRCLEDADGGSSQSSDGLRLLMSDVAALELHIILPPDWPLTLADVSGRWKDLDAGFRAVEIENLNIKRVEPFDKLLHAMTNRGEKPGLYFAHLLLPHVPWNYLPSGKQYPWSVSEQQGSMLVSDGVIGLRRPQQRWCEAPWAVRQALQRHLLQLTFVDRMIGELVEHMKAEGIYDESIIVIAADHGVSFIPGKDRRGGREENDSSAVTPGGIDEEIRMDVMSIPLIIKAPHQKHRGTSDRNMQSADVLPTIAELLEAEVPWTVDGVSAFDANTPPPEMKGLSVPAADGQTLTFPAETLPRSNTYQRMLQVFGSDTGSGELFRIGPNKELIGRRIDELDVSEDSTFKRELTFSALFENVDPGDQFMPCYITGRVARTGATEEEGQQSPPLELAIAINGTIQAVTRTFAVEGFQDTFAAMVPEESFRQGKNDVRVFVVSKTGDTFLLR